MASPIAAAKPLVKGMVKIFGSKEAREFVKKVLKSKSSKEMAKQMVS